MQNAAPRVERREVATLILVPHSGFKLKSHFLSQSPHSSSAPCNRQEDSAPYTATIPHHRCRYSASRCSPSDYTRARNSPVVFRRSSVVVFLIRTGPRREIAGPAVADGGELSRDVGGAAANLRIRIGLAKGTERIHDPLPVRRGDRLLAVALIEVLRYPESAVVRPILPATDRDTRRVLREYHVYRDVPSAR